MGPFSARADQSAQYENQSCIFGENSTYQSPCSSSGDLFDCFLPSPFACFSSLTLLPQSAAVPSCLPSSACLACVSAAETIKSSKAANPVDSLLGFFFRVEPGRKERLGDKKKKKKNAALTWRRPPLFQGSSSRGLNNHFRNHSLNGNRADEASASCTRELSNNKGPNARLDSLDTIKVSKHLLAGAMSAVVSRTLVAPLERLKLEYIVRGARDDVLDVARLIYRTEGLNGFWKGNFVNIIRTAPFKSINFYAYDALRKQIMTLTGRKEISNFEKLAAGATAGILATMICFPMDTIRTKMVAPGGEAMGGIVGCFKLIIRDQGFTSLYAGLAPALISMAPAGAVFYGVYDILKTGYLTSSAGQAASRRRGGAAAGDHLKLDPFRTLLYGAIAGACAETVTYPFEVVRRQLQLQDAANRLGVLNTAKTLLDQGGIGALYAGLLPSTLQVLPSAALSYFVYEWMKMSLKVS